MHPSNDPLWKLDADGFDARRIVLPMAIGLATVAVAAEVYFLIAWQNYDVRKGNLPLACAVLAFRFAFPGLRGGTPIQSGPQGGRRLVMTIALFGVGLVSVLWPGPPSWARTGFGFACLVASVVVARARRRGAGVSQESAGPA